MIDQQPISVHWNYFLALEAELGEMARWIEPAKANESTYSIELARLLMASSAECDVVLKALCKRIDPTTKVGSIGSYHPIITGEFKAFRASRVRVPKFGLEFTPWDTWEPNTSPLWWTANNQVKHHRSDHFPAANLKNTLNALAALFVATSHLELQDRYSVDSSPQFFEADGFAYRDGRMLVFYGGLRIGEVR